MTAFLGIEGLAVGYGKALVIPRLDLAVAQGEFVAVIGPNGAGKSTLLNSLMGLLPAREGHVRFLGEEISRLRPEARLARGMVLVPERRDLFGSMPVIDNLRLGAFQRYLRRDRAIADDLHKVFAVFPVLRERSAQTAATLSGGEQQMLAIGRALMSRPQLLLLDEPSIGLAPRVIEDIFAAIRGLKEQGLTAILVEQNAHLALSVADRAYVLEMGEIVLAG
ncbi:MAG: ABC transporter ATP-binding protein, partial [Burkholderiales bacterium]|nr:ABC transporter ATP-binding protein [Burkholderiales bacterium]